MLPSMWPEVMPDGTGIVPGTVGLYPLSPGSANFPDVPIFFSFCADPIHPRRSTRFR